MIRTILVSALTVLLSLENGVVIWASENNRSKLTILNPKQGAVIKGDSIEVRYRLSKAVHATHIHCYVDGEYQRGFTGVIKGLTPGSHEIKIVAADHDHKALDHEARVVIQVE